MLEIEDTYFANFAEALEIAKLQNKFTAYNNLQLCYYDGPEVKNSYPNLINLPKEKISTRLLELGTRIPTSFKTKDNNLISKYIEDFKEKKEKEHLKLINKIKDSKLNFNESLRVYISADYGGKVVLKTYQFLYNLFLEQNFKVYFDINDNITIMDDFRRAKSLDRVKPHITININRLRNTQLNEDTFNFSWFMDPTLVLFDNSKLQLRKKDYIFYIGDEILNALKNKNVPTKKIIHQFLTPDYKKFYQSKNIIKEEKVIFVGQNYFEVIEPTIGYKNHPVVKELTTLFNENKITKEILKELSLKYSSTIKRPEHIEIFIYPAVVRLETVKWMCSQNLIKAEIYGSGWDNIDELSKYTKGVINSETDLNDIYNTAKYSLVVHSNFMYIPKLFESSACGAIPIVYQGITTLDKFEYQDNVLIFTNKKDFEKTLINKPKKDSSQISNEISTSTIINKIMNIVQKDKF